MKHRPLALLTLSAALFAALALALPACTADYPLVERLEAVPASVCAARITGA